jgi:hypothetical protein
VGVKKEPVDNSEFHKSTPYPARDLVYNKIVDRYGVKGNAWKTSDSIIFQGFIYYVWDYVMAIVVIGVLTWILVLTYDRFGLAKTGIVAFVMLLWRVNILIRQGAQANRLMGAK